MNIKRIPDMSEIRTNRPKQLCVDIDTNHPLHNDPMVDLKNYPKFEDAVSYYSQPNRMTGKPLPGVPNEPLLREDAANRLAEAEHFLASSEVEQVFGCPLHIQVRDALRSIETQKIAFEEAWPAIIKANPEKYPGYSEDFSEEELLNFIAGNNPGKVTYCAKPNPNSPHVVGGAVNIRLVNANTGKLFDRGLNDIPEAYEDNLETNPQIALLRRLQYHAMVNIAGFAQNPGLIWQYTIGDPLWGYLTGNQPYYGQV